MQKSHREAISNGFLHVTEPFAVTGPSEMTLTEGYASTGTDSFSVLGTERESMITVALEDAQNPYADKFHWNEEIRQLEIAEGLPAGNYEAVLTAAEQDEGIDTGNYASCHFILHVSADRRPELQEAYQEALAWTAGHYTSASMAKFQAVLSRIEDVLENPAATADDVEKAIELLRGAGDALETLEAAWTRLAANYTKTETEKGMYTPASWKAYQEKLGEICNLPDGYGEEEMIERLDELAQAVKLLVRAADKRRLKALVDAAGAMDSSKYTSNSYAAMLMALEAATAVYRNENAIQADVDAAENKLRIAVGMLAEVAQNRQELPEGAAVEKGQKHTDAKSKIQYQVINVSKRKVKVIRGTDKKAVSVTIPAFIIINDIKFNVTEIGDNAFKGFKKLKKVTIGSNVAKIGKKSFYNCRNLAKVTVKGTKITSVKSKAFQNTAKKSSLILPGKMSAKQKRDIKKKLKNAGLRLK